MKQFFVALIFLLFRTAAVQAQDVSWRKADGHWERKNSLTVSTRFFGSPAPRSTTICPWCLGAILRGDRELRQPDLELLNFNK